MQNFTLNSDQAFHDMKPEDAYALWAEQYDSNNNRTRDLEAVSIRETLNSYSFENCLEIGCGTGKNTEFLVVRADKVTAADLSEEMLQKAREKKIKGIAEFLKFDAKSEWNFGMQKFDLITFSLVLEHFEDLMPVFANAASVISRGGYVYIGELHPFKQYAGTKARFDNGGETKIVECYVHNVSDFTTAAAANNFEIVLLNEYFDDGNRNGIPRILTLLLRHNANS